MEKKVMFVAFNKSQNQFEAWDSIADVKEGDSDDDYDTGLITEEIQLFTDEKLKRNKVYKVTVSTREVGTKKDVFKRIKS